MDYAEIGMVNEVIDDLTVELQATDDQFNASLLSSKVVGAYRDVVGARRYPSHYTEDDIVADMEQFYHTVRELALYDYNKIGFEGQSRNAENEVSRTFADRSSLFNGVIPLSRI